MPRRSASRRVRFVRSWASSMTCGQIVSILMIVTRRKRDVEPGVQRGYAGFIDRLNARLLPYIGPPPLGPYDEEPAPVHPPDLPDLRCSDVGARDRPFVRAHAVALPLNARVTDAAASVIHQPCSAN